MSTKIYQGVIARNLGIWEAFSKNRDTILKIMEDYTWDTVLSNALTLYDQYSLGMPGEYEEDATYMARSRLLRLDKDDPQREQFNASLYLAEDSETPHSYGIYRGDSRQFEQVLQHSSLEEYGYWNNTDQPATVSDEEWEERRDLWNRVLPGVGRLTTNLMGVTLYDCMEAQVFILREDYASYAVRDQRMPSIMSRAEHIAQHIADNATNKALQTVREEKGMGAALDKWFPMSLKARFASQKLAEDFAQELDSSPSATSKISAFEILSTKKFDSTPPAEHPLVTEAGEAILHELLTL